MEKLVYGSVCSGISAESVAWEPLGWKAAWFSQFDPEHNYKSGPDFPSAVLAHHYPQIPNLGDVNHVREKKEFKTQEIDLLVGGTPCQSFSIQGSRRGFDDPRGKLALRFLEVAEMRRPRWLVWENVEAALCANGGKDFGALLWKMGKLGYGYAWRVLDARDFGLAQSRRRVFLVGYLGAWKRAAAVFSEREGVRRSLEAEPDAATERGGANAKVAGADSAVFAVQGSVINRRLGAGPQGIAVREGLMYCLTVSDRHAVIADGIVRYILPVEEERLQGLPDNYTKIPYKDRRAEECPDALRHKAVGNAFAVPVMRWIGQRIAFVDSLPDERVKHFLPADDRVRTLTDSELVERCVRGFRRLKEIVPYLREARERFAQPGRRVPVPGNPTWSEWVETNLGVTVRRVQQLLREFDPSEMISRGSKQTRTLRTGDWRSLVRVTEGRTAQVFGALKDEEQLAAAIRKFAQALADRYSRKRGRIAVAVSVSP